MRKLYPLTPRVADVDIDDIAHSLSQKCRFTGHTKTFYSVAQHSVLVSEFVPRPLAMAGLLHDASEYMLPDVASPIKGDIRGFRELEEGVLDAVFKKFGLFELRGNEEVHRLIKEADDRVFSIEVRDCMREGGEWEIKYEADPYITITPWTPEEAKKKFLARFEQIQSMMLSHLEALDITI